MSFIEERLLDALSMGFSGGPTWATRRHELRNGIVRRNAQRSRPLHRFTGTFEKQDEDVVEILLNTFNATQGATFGFRFQNPLDFEAENEFVTTAGEGDLDLYGEQEAQLLKTYTFGNRDVAVPIRKPNDDVILFADGVFIPSFVDTTTGIVTFEATEGQVITWSGTFDLPVMFSNDDFIGVIEQWDMTTVDVQLEEDLSE